MIYIKQRRPIFSALILPFFTLGLYFYYWLFNMGRELAAAKGEKYNSALFMFVGILTSLGIIYVYYKVAKMATEVTQKTSVWKYFLLLLFIPPIGVYLIQRDVNKKASPKDEIRPEPKAGSIFERIGLVAIDYWWAIPIVLIYFLVFAYLLLAMGAMWDTMQLIYSLQTMDSMSGAEMELAMEGLNDMTAGADLETMTDEELQEFIQNMTEIIQNAEDGP